MDKFPLTKKGFLRLEQELKDLKGIERPNVIAAIAEARSHGDLSENAEYSAAKEKQSFIEGRIQELEAVISRAQVIDPTEIKGNVIRFGATVAVVDVDTDKENSYQIVGDYEADINENNIKEQLYYNWRIEMWGEGKALMTLKRFDMPAKKRGSNHYTAKERDVLYSDYYLRYTIPYSEYSQNPSITYPEIIQ